MDLQNIRVQRKKTGKVFHKYVDRNKDNGDPVL